MTDCITEIIGSAKFSHYVALMGCVILTTTAQLFFKVGASKGKKVLWSFLNPITAIGYLLFGINTVLAVYVLQAVEMKIVSTWAAMPYLLVVLFAAILLKETLTIQKIAGSLLIMAGVVIFCI
jgi:uncharacterized membrane protein